MAKPQIVFEPRAKQELKDIHNFIARDCEDKADSFLKKITDEIEKMFSFGSNTENLNPLLKGYRHINYGKYMIIYKIKSEHVRVFSVYHSARDITRF